MSASNELISLLHRYVDYTRCFVSLPSKTLRMMALGSSSRTGDVEGPDGGPARPTSANSMGRSPRYVYTRPQSEPKLSNSLTTLHPRPQRSRRHWSSQLAQQCHQPPQHHRRRWRPRHAPRPLTHEHPARHPYNTLGWLDRWLRPLSPDQVRQISGSGLGVFLRPVANDVSECCGDI